MQAFLIFAVLLFVPPLEQTSDAEPAIFQALMLPVLVTQARRAGVTEVVLNDVLEGLRRRGLPAAEATLVVGEEVAALRAGASKDTFGSFVQTQLDAGLRGRELAHAIRAEHLARGIGHGDSRQQHRRDTTGPAGRRP